MTRGDALLPAAGLWRRFMSIAYECVLLFGVLFFFNYAFSALTQFKGQTGPMLWAFQVFNVIVLGVYFAGLWSDGRRTLPMKTMHVRLTTLTGEPVGRGRAVVRFAVALALIVVGIAAGRYVHPLLGMLVVAGQVWAVFDRDRQTLYDRVSGTRLVHDRAAAAPR